VQGRPRTQLSSAAHQRCKAASCTAARRRRSQRREMRRDGKETPVSRACFGARQPRPPLSPWRHPPPSSAAPRHSPDGTSPPARRPPMQGRTARALGSLPPRPLCSPRHALIRDIPCGRSLRPLTPTPALQVGWTVRYSLTANMPKRRAAEADTLAKRLLRCELVHLPCHCFPRQRHTSHARSV